MIKNILVATVLLFGGIMLMGLGASMFTAVAEGSKPVYERQGWTRIEGPGSCYIYYKHVRDLGKTIYASTCTSIAVTG